MYNVYVLPSELDTISKYYHNRMILRSLKINGPFVVNITIVYIIYTYILRRRRISSKNCMGNSYNILYVYCATEKRLYNVYSIPGYDVFLS